MTCTLYLAIIPARNISKFSKYFPNVLDNFEISLAVLLPNFTISHAITYTNSLIIHTFTNQSKYTNLAMCVCLETPMKHWTEAFPLNFDEIPNPRA